MALRDMTLGARPQRRSRHFQGLHVGAVLSQCDGFCGSVMGPLSTGCKPWRLGRAEGAHLAVACIALPGPKDLTPSSSTTAWCSP